MDWGNAFVRTITGSSPITALTLELNLTGDFKKTDKKVTWLSPSPSSPLVPIVLLDYDYLIYKKKLAEEDQVEDCLTPVTEFRTLAVGDGNARALKKGEVVQFEKKGYYIVDKPFGERSELVEGEEGVGRVEMIFIPDGRSASTNCKYTPPVVAKAAKAKKVVPATVGGGAGEGAKKVEEPKTPSGRIPEPAPLEAVESTLLSNGKTGFEILVKTKMFRVPSVYGEDGVEAVATTVMHDVKPVYDL